MTMPEQLMPTDGEHAARALGYLAAALSDDGALLLSPEAAMPLMIDLWAEAVERTTEQAVP